jgi:hypothetical protein
MPERRLTAAVVVATGVIAVLLLTPATAAMAVTINGDNDDDAVVVTAREWQAAVDAHASAVAAGDPVASLVEYARGVQCNVTTVPLTTALNGPCGGADGFVAPLVCPDGATALLALWTRTRTSAGAPWTAWTYVATGACPQDVLPALTLADFRRLPLTPTLTTIQPGTRYVLVNYGIIVTADPTPVDLTTTLLGYPVTVHAVPASYTWDFGDDTAPLDTTDPGTPYPTDGTRPATAHGSIYPVGSHGHPYTAPGTYTLTLTTQWTGTYQIAGDTTRHPITGTATTTTTHPPLTVVERRTHLVADNCLTNPHGPGC